MENLIANLRGIPEDHSLIERKGPKDLDGIITSVMERYKIGIESLEDHIRENWKAIVGEENARYCHPVRIERDTTLIIAVTNPIIRQELQFNRTILLQKIHKIKNGREIRQVVFKSG